MQRAIRMLRQVALEQDYAEAWDGWATSGDEAAREMAAPDGLADAAR